MTRHAVRRSVAAWVVTYWAVYPDGRRCSVTLTAAKAFEKRWAEDGVRVVTTARRTTHEIVGEIEFE